MEFGGLIEKSAESAEKNPEKEYRPRVGTLCQIPDTASVASRPTTRVNPVALPPTFHATLLVPCALTSNYNYLGPARSAPASYGTKNVLFCRKCPTRSENDPIRLKFDRNQVEFDHSASNSAQNSRVLPFIRSAFSICFSLVSKKTKRLSNRNYRQALSARAARLLKQG